MDAVDEDRDEGLPIDNYDEAEVEENSEKEDDDIPARGVRHRYSTIRMHSIRRGKIPNGFEF